MYLQLFMHEHIQYIQYTHTHTVKVKGIKSQMITDNIQCVQDLLKEIQSQIRLLIMCVLFKQIAKKPITCAIYLNIIVNI